MPGVALLLKVKPPVGLAIDGEARKSPPTYAQGNPVTPERSDEITPLLRLPEVIGDRAPRRAAGT
jgi:hypothetical protein